LGGEGGAKTRELPRTGRKKVLKAEAVPLLQGLGPQLKEGDGESRQLLQLQKKKGRRRHVTIEGYFGGESGRCDVRILVLKGSMGRENGKEDSQ